jgi:hypothetical protein
MGEALEVFGLRGGASDASYDFKAVLALLPP